VDTQHAAHCLLISYCEASIVSLQWSKAVNQVITVSVASCEEEDSDEVGIACVDGLKNLFENMGCAALPERATGDKVGEPKCVEG